MRPAAATRACFFSVGARRYALDASRLVRVAEVGELTRVPRTGPELLGLFAQRGQVMPLIDLHPIVGLEQDDLRPSLAALVQARTSTFALNLEVVLGFAPLGKLEPLTVSVDTSSHVSPKGPCLRGYTTFEDEPAWVLNLDVLADTLGERLQAA